MELRRILDENDEKFLVKSFKESKTMVLLSDTVYGISSSLRSLAIKNIYKIKKRDKSKLFIILVSDLLMLKKYFFVSSQQDFFIKKSLSDKNSRAISFILKPKKDLLFFLDNNYKNGVAVRLPKSKFLIKIIKLIKEPIISTSCNISGEKSLNNLKDIKNFFEKRNYRPDLIISTPYLRPKKKASKLVDIRDINNVKNIRN